MREINKSLYPWLEKGYHPIAAASMATYILWMAVSAIIVIHDAIEHEDGQLVAMSALCIAWMASVGALVIGSCTADLGEGYLITFIGLSDDSMGVEYDDMIGLRGTILGRAPHVTGNGPGDELWIAVMDNGVVLELWSEEISFEPQLLASVLMRRMIDPRIWILR